MRGLAEGAKDTCSTVEIHPEKNGKLEKLELGEKPRFQGGKKNIISEMHEKEREREGEARDEKIKSDGYSRIIREGRRRGN